MRLLDLLAHKSDVVHHAKTKAYGMSVTVEHPRGSVRTLHDDKGKVVYKKRMYHHYGYLDKTKGQDGDEVDCFLGPEKTATEIYIVHMLDKGPVVKEREDEDKVFIGFKSANDAKRAFLLHYDPSFFGGMTTLPVAVFKKKIKDASLPHHKRKITAGVQCF